MLNQCSILLNAIVNATNNNNYFIDVTNLGLHNKDSKLVTQASIFLVIYIYIYIYVTAIERKTLYGLRVLSHNIPQCNSHHNCRN